ncbi:DUF1223 domain-containing protein [Flexibacterium corallicola]|uniref:DUF1223 domain-containing protein n=1 Tax=Flexibacterium corallicola TaxID=3037259 RepID=UPI00286F1DD9|nr:DUF1223 domain-containing protein [Pseudovibrio sp. M1P-2-3]
MKLRPAVKTLAMLAFVSTFALLNVGMVYAQPVKAVVELYSSQGCGYCPPANKLLSELSKKPNVIAMDFHVNIWDFMGWKDTLANKKNTDRQRAYALSRHDKGVYTPQAIINGKQDVAGNDRQGLLETVEAQTPLSLDVNARIDKTMLDVSVSGKAHPLEPTEADIYLLRLTKKKEVDIQGGDNAGKDMQYVNVVTDIIPIGMWMGKDTVLRFPKSALGEINDNTQWVVLVQSMNTKGPGPILGATKFEGI